MLTLGGEAAQLIRRLGAEGFPHEVCGLLAGRQEKDHRIALQAWPVPNRWDAAEEGALFETEGGEAGWADHGRERRFFIAPADLLAAMKRAREEGLELVGTYHTHPDHPAAPSRFDRDAAWPGWSYLILSVRDGRAAEMRSWVCRHEEPFVEEELMEATG